MKPTKYLLPWLFIVTLGLFSAVHSQKAYGAGYIPPMPESMDQTDFYLLTVGLGDDLYTRFGHTILRIVDHRAGVDYNFNWGTFDWNEPNFAWNFFRGVLMYRMSLASFSQTMATYRDWEQRRVWQDKINLTSAQKRTLMQRIIWNSQPQNLKYPYQYFFRNCSTQVRDYFDEALNGALLKAFKDVPSNPPKRFRDHVRSNLGGNPFVGVSLDILMNGDIDRQMTKWDDMFLPIKLREHLMQTPAVDDSGQPLTGTTLLHGGEVLVDLPDRPLDDTAARGGFVWFALVGWLPLVPVFPFFFRHVRRRLRAGFAIGEGKPMATSWSLSGWHRRFAGAACLVWGMFAGAYGLTMTVTWILSDHSDLHHNANLWLFWPLDWIFCVVGIVFLRNQNSSKLAGLHSSIFLQFIRMLALLHILGAIILGLGALIGFIKQDVSNVLLFLALPFVMINLFLLSCVPTEIRSDGVKS